MRKRTVIALFLSILCVVAMNRYWLVFKPLHIGFDINGKGDVFVEVLLNKKNDLSFKKVKRAGYNIDLSKASRFDLEIGHVTSPKRLKVALIKGFEPSGGGGWKCCYFWDNI